jgi:hypothetical protein
MFIATQGSFTSNFRRAWLTDSPSLIVSALERRFPLSQGYQTLFPPTKSGKTDTGLAKLFAKYYAESALFTPATTLIPWEKLPAPFLKDRSEASNVD